jgi:uncharacterized protein YkwD
MKTSQHPTLGRLAACLLVAAALAACGGGGDDGDTAATAPSASDPQAPPQAAAPVPPSPSASAPAAADGTCALADFQAEALRWINQYRAAGASCGARGSFSPAAALAWSTPLDQAALRHSNDMVANNFFSHTGSYGSKAGQRITDAGYNWRTWGENISAGRTSVQTVVEGWMRSDGHCANIMNPAFRDVGLACVKGTASNRYGTYWTMTLGAAR